MTGIFVAGTDTGVGKTVAAAILIARYLRERKLAYWKPIATGAREERDSETVARLTAEGVAILPEYALFQDPVSPHLAARREGRPIVIADVLAAHARHAKELAVAGRHLVVEGAGGLLVPLDDDGGLLIDLIALMPYPVLLVARSTLGTINHTLLSIAALRSRTIPVAGVVLVGPRNDENRAAIQRLGGAAVLGEIPYLDPLDATTVARAAGALDSRSRIFAASVADSLR